MVDKGCGLYLDSWSEEAPIKVTMQVLYIDIYIHIHIYI